MKFAIDRSKNLQDQLRSHLLELIISRHFIADKPLPSCRKLSSQLRVSRNSVALAYEYLRDDGYLISQSRRGYFIAPDYSENTDAAALSANTLEHHNAPKWCARFKKNASDFLTVVKPGQWMEYEHPFVYGQLDTDFFPLARWREVERKVTGNKADKEWLYDRFDHDHSPLIEQLRTQVLPKRGIIAADHEILLTLGAQNGLSLLSELLLNKDTCIGVENPGYREALSTFSLQGAEIKRHQIDDNGIRLEHDSAACDYFYVTPNHQSPTGVSMSTARRKQLLHLASTHNQIIIEDDFDSHISSCQQTRMALKADDKEGRVIYVGSLSKVISPGLRLGYIVGSMELIDELRSLRRLRYRHPPSIIQYQMAYFLEQGYYETYMKRYHRCSLKRHNILHAALIKHLPDCSYQVNYATAFWIKAPEHIDTQKLAWQAARFGVLIEPGEIHFSEPNPPKNFFRLGFNAIRPDAIEPGIIKLARAMQMVSKQHTNSA